MILKLSLLITFVFVTNCAARVEKDESFNIENVWRKTACKSTPHWLNGVQKYYNDIIITFGSFPSEVSGEAELVVETFQALLTKLVDSSNSRSEILSTGATTVLEAFSRIKIAEQSAQGIINEFYRVLPILMKAYRGIATYYTPVIGTELVSAVNNALNNLECACELYVEKFNAGDGNGRKIAVDDEPVRKSVQNLEDTITLNGDVKLSKHELADRKVQNALLILSLILDHMIICKHGLRSASETILLEQKA
ncbi:uncharacterized protein LOC119076135 [Bradysia coprophila]|uniref:uncharacterized protein LOC119076135 n=1 Tax=Bradysia coprophila TaxID=38358 RepID=UPI00187D8287|nr:uncharacterized protein LOC119076135 [Bradysia coprophila]